MAMLATASVEQPHQHREPEEGLLAHGGVGAPLFHLEKGRGLTGQGW